MLQFKPQRREEYEFTQREGMFNKFNWFKRFKTFKRFKGLIRCAGLRG